MGASLTRIVVSNNTNLEYWTKPRASYGEVVASSAQWWSALRAIVSYLLSCADTFDYKHTHLLTRNEPLSQYV